MSFNSSICSTPMKVGVSGDQISRIDIQAQPGQVLPLLSEFDPETTHIGILAAFRDIDNAIGVLSLNCRKLNSGRRSTRSRLRSWLYVWTGCPSAPQSKKRLISPEEAPMSWKNKVVSSEGLFLRPQHFQRRRYLESCVEGRTGTLQAYSWGLTELTIDRDQLGIGKFAVATAKGVFPDGTPFDIPEDAPPIPLDIHRE